MLFRSPALGAVLLAAAVGSADAAVPPANPCAYVSNDDVFHALGWTVTGRERKPYDLHGGTGEMCFIASTQGQVVVILPDPGSGYPGISVSEDPNAVGLTRKLPGLGADVTLYNGTVYITRKHRDVAVRVVPQNHAASYAEVAPFAKIVIRRMR